jgi:outer membrane protein assembly factor BamB
MPKRKRDVVFVGASGKVMAVDADTGTEIWRTKLKASGTVVLHRDAERLYATVAGELFCVDPSSGTIRWHNKLKGLGLGIVSLATEPGDAEHASAYVPIAQALRQQAAAAHGAAG